jgi:xylulokinase
MSIYLGIDIGTSGTKTLAMNERGKILAQALSTYPCYHPKPLWSEQDPDDWWDGTVKSVRAVVKKAKLKPHDVRAIGLSGQMHGSVFLDKQNRVVRRALLWNDQRTAAECQEIEKRAGGRKKLIEMVANPALTGFTAPKILWLRNNEPKNFAKTVKVLLPKDEIRRRLTGEFATEVSDASGMLLLDVVHRRWSKELLSKLELDPSWFARCYESEEITGRLTPEAAKMLGLSTDCMVVGGAGDCAAGAVGNGIVRQGVLSTSIGTSGVVFVHSDSPQVDPEGRLHTFCHAVNGKWHMMGVTLAAGGSLQWFRNALCEQLAAMAKKRKIDVYDVLTEEAAVTPPARRGCSSCRTWRVSGRRTPIRSRAGHSWG